MNLFSFFTRKDKENLGTEKTPTTSADRLKYAPSVAPEEKKYYQPDEYYTYKTGDGQFFDITVIPFEDRRKKSYPSKRGLYVAEILLLDYCLKGNYPHPANGYPAFWWFKYGIRDVGKVLSSLEMRGFIEYGDYADALAGMTLAELKSIATSIGLTQAGKKSELVSRIINASSEEKLASLGVEKKYRLTPIGQQELQDNEYIPFMHKHKRTTLEGSPFGYEFNIWTINRLVHSKPGVNWRDIVETEERKLPFLQENK